MRRKKEKCCVATACPWMVPFRLMHNFRSNRGLGRDSSFVHCSGEHDSLVMMMICGGGGMNSLGFDFWPWQYEI